MDRDQHIRHHASPQFTDSLSHDSWLADAGDASSFSDPTSLEPSWMVPLFDDFTPDATLHHSPASSQNSTHGVTYAYRSQNALGLDISLESPTYPTLPYSYSLYPDGHYSMHTPSPGPLRMNLPQIITNDLQTQSQGSSNATGLHSPSDLSLAAMGPHYPQSAGTSSPSTAGQNSLPVTPSSLPATVRPHLTIPTSTALYSPASQYISGLHSNVSSPTKSPLLRVPAPSPSMSPMVVHHTPGSYTVPIHRGAVESVLEIASKWPDAAFLVPQRTYRPNTQSDRRRYVEEVDLEMPIMFFTQHPDGCGINCKDAINSRFSRLHGRDDSMFQNRGPSVSIRINWPGYTPWSRQIPTRDFRSPPGPITRSKLAKNVAKTVLRFLDEKKDKPVEDEADPKYKVAHITIDQIDIVGLQHVSMGSWQAHLRLRPRT
ncbi:uncharacterized protein PHACADRAFT_263741 [Phanerochaete carnosa HHB-10118-sp]|uniref:Uncharacterized protein n=1 Tax=Phanerochaete carnosa (strain HHB-10118-sp) TaxID=650164 RepID=K5VGW0_PHACS|nr:uncharacterized protein PHACADRAFT_263741 [Phanerochaete carnosa HHB-10118-sp]EKM50443.1 hypothetical protein PHACADRAFT_263741 [Phanerochaete carnosa HHB-10118-sp]